MGTFLNSGDAVYLPAQLYHAHALSQPAPESDSGTGRSQGAALNGCVYQSACAGHGGHTGRAVHW